MRRCRAAARGAEPMLTTAFSFGSGKKLETLVIGQRYQSDSVLKQEPAMLSKIMFGALAVTTALTALPAAAEAQGYYRGDRYNGRGYYRDYDRGYYRHYPRRRSSTRVYVDVGYPAYYGGYYGPGYYGPSYYNSYYGPSYYRGGYYGRGYGRGYYRGGYRCDNGTTGAIVGGAAGALVGREIGRDGRGYRYRHRGSGTTGAIIGGALGALIGSEASRC
jgi:Glycine zipper 2TM domain